MLDNYLAYLYSFYKILLRDTMTLNFGDLNARARDPTATFELINLLTC